MFLLLVLLVAIPPNARADYFQIFDGKTPYYIPYAEVTINGQRRGYTDMYGRIRLTLPAGTYTGEIVYHQQHKRITITIDGRSELKRITAA
jgi:hypothetical protein